MLRLLTISWASLTAAVVTANAQMAETKTPAATAPATGLPFPKDTLEFLNGDLLRGSFLSIEDKGSLRWQHTSIKQVLNINPGGIYKVRLQPPKSAKLARPNCAVRFSNGDELFGNLIGLDETNLLVDTWYAGQLTLPRENLQSLTLGLGRFNVIYEGPTGPEGWSLKGNPNININAGMVIGGVVDARVAAARRIVQSGWQYKDEAFIGVGNGAVGRNVNLPPLSNIEFDMAWRGYPQISFFFYTDNLEAYGGNAYVMQFSYRNVYLRRQSQSGRSSNLGTIEMPNLGLRSKTHVAIRTDREKRTIALFMDDTLVKQWTDGADFTEAGTGIMFYLQGQQAMKISGIRITEWDGRLDDNPVVAANPKQDLARLVNKDKVSGTLKGIRDGKMSFATAFAALEVPLERISQIEFAAENVKTNALATNEVRVFFAERGRLTMQVERWDDQQIVGSSRAIGTTKFLPAAFSAIQFNLDKQKVDTDALDALPNIGVQPQMFIED